ncbi:hypothetical protein JFL43_13835 [Viridibacillus sp. YIM B01967]|uniref:ABC transporter permease n=1 Tax=Viridibacillus soli TaxID=2798301 RepID=A0ABS1H9D2_9BACL|nr:hypothetical protein [Viridibacillus soli]MBK3495921.1 hypothetical protein [Viridibacillus soli]
MSLMMKAMKAQIKFKLNAYSEGMIYLIVFQIIGVVLFSFSGSGQMGRGAGNFKLEISLYSPAGIFILSALWMFYVAVSLTRKETRRELLPFICLPKLSSISDIIILIGMSAFLSFTVMLSNYLLYDIIVLFTKKEFSGSMAIFDEPKVFFINLIGVFIVSMTVAAFGYLIGTLVQISKLFIIVLIALFIAYVKSKLILFIGHYFYEQNPQFLPFAIFNIAIAISCFFIAYLISSRMEVKGV